MEGDFTMSRLTGYTGKLPPHVFFLVSAVFHYLGPSFAVILFSQISVLGVAWLRIASAAVLFTLWRKPWRVFQVQSKHQKLILIIFGTVLGLMNCSFYLAISRLPLGTVGAIEFIGPIILAALGVRSGRNIVALVLAATGGWLLTQVRLSGEPLGYVFAFINCALFMLYVILGHWIAKDGGAAGIDRLGVAMVFALLIVSPIGFADASFTLTRPSLLLAGIGVGISSSVIPYITDQLAMARLSRSTFALMLSLLPATATTIGILVLHQIPSSIELLGILSVACGIALHQEHEPSHSSHALQPADGKFIEQSQ
jgi:inner membrane transporter RhtA